MPLHTPVPTNFALNAKAFGAVGDGASHLLSSRYATLGTAQADYPQATALTDEIDGRAIEAMLRRAAALNTPCYIPPGVYKVNKPILVGGLTFTSAAPIGVAGLVVQGAGAQPYSDAMLGTTLEWTGNATDPMWWLQDANSCTFMDITVKGLVGTPLYAAWRTENYAYWDGSAVQTGPVNNTKNAWLRCQVTGVNGYIAVGWWAPKATTIDAGNPTGVIDANNDFHLFEHCQASNYSLAAFLINHTQAKAWRMVNCWVRGKQDTARCAVGVGYDFVAGADVFTNGGSFQWEGGGGAGHSTPLGAPVGLPADYIIGGASSDIITVKDANWEKSYRLVYVNGLSSAGVPVLLEGVRWAHAGYGVADGSYVRHWAGGPVTLIGCRIQDDLPSGGRNMRVESGNGGGINYAPVTLIGNIIETTDINRVANLPNGQYSLTAFGNTYRRTSDGVTGAFPNVQPRRPVPAAKAADYTAQHYDAGGVVIMDTAAAIRTFTLPTAVGVPGMQFTVKRKGANSVTIATTSSQTIDGAAASTFNLATDFAKLTVVSDGANWLTV
jgi:hypothetical protein